MDQQYDFDQYLEVTKPRDGCPSRLAERLYYLCSGSDSKQIFAAVSPHNSVQVTDFSSPVTFVSCSPLGGDVVFGKLDEPGIRQELYLADFESLKNMNSAAETYQLGIGSSASYRWGSWHPRGDRVAFVVNRDDSKEFSLYVQQIKPEVSHPELIREDIGWVNVHGWSPSGESLLCVRSYSMRTQELLSVDIASGSVTELTGVSTGTQFLHPCWLSDSQSILTITNAGSNTSYLANINVQSKEITGVLDGGGWNFEELDVSTCSERIAYTRNVDGYSELSIGTLHTPTEIGDTTNVELPSGVAHDLCFDSSGRYLSLTFTNSRIPSRLYVVDTLTGDAQLWVTASTGDIPRDAFLNSKLVRFESFDGLEIPGYLSVPDQPVHEQVPVIIDIHGGPETQRHPVFRALNQYLLNNGYAVFEPNIRGSAGYGRDYVALDDIEKRLDAVADVKAAADWLGSLERIDSDKIVLMGKSYGGFVVLSAATLCPTRWAAAIDICGIANFVSYLNTIGESRRPLREAEYGSLDEHEELLRELSPIHDIENIECPLMVVHGENDRRVPIEEAYQVVQKARQEGVAVKSLFLPNEGHSFERTESHYQIVSELASFLQSYV